MAMVVGLIMCVVGVMIMMTIIRGIVDLVMHKHYTKEQYKLGARVGLLCIAIAFLICILGNNNQNPNSFISWVLRPIINDSSMISMGPFIVLGLIYYLIYKIYRLTQTKWLDETWKKLLAVIVVMMWITPLPDYLLRTYRSYQESVDSIYLYRDEMEISLIDEGKDEVRIEGEVRLENLASKRKDFAMKIRLPKEWQDLVGLEWIEVHPEGERMYEIGAKDKERVDFEVSLQKKPEVSEQRKGNSSYYLFEFVLYDEIDEAYFEVDAFDKHYYFNSEE